MQTRIKPCQASLPFTCSAEGAALQRLRPADVGDRCQAAAVQLQYLQGTLSPRGCAEHGDTSAVGDPPARTQVVRCLRRQGTKSLCQLATSQTYLVS